jgi:hypothetical protein
MENHMRFVRVFVTLLFASTLLWGCDLPGLPTERPSLPEIGGLPDVLRDLGLPDLSSVPNLPDIGDLPALSVGPNAVAFAGPTERRINVGERIPGTDIELAAIGAEGAEFRIAGLRSVRSMADSLDYDGAWTGANGVEYNLRLRIYYVGDNNVRAAGVHRLVVQNIQPVEQQVSLQGNTLRVPYTASVSRGETLKGLTFGYRGAADRGAEITGLPPGDFPYRSVGDSIRWQGRLRPDIPIQYDLRVLLFNENTLQVGGIATIQLPGQ